MRIRLDLVCEDVNIQSIGTSRARTSRAAALLSLGLAWGCVVARANPLNAIPPPQAGARKSNSSDAVRIVPTTMAPNSVSMEKGSDSWSARGYDPKTLIAEIYDLDVRRVDFPDDRTSGGRYDVTLNLPEDTNWDAMKQMILDALKRKFGLTITPEDRTMEVFVLTAPNGPGAGLHRAAESSHPEAGNEEQMVAGLEEQVKFEARGCTGLASADGITASGATISFFSRTLEADLDRLLVDETGLPGSYDFEIPKYASQQELFQQLSKSLGLVITPAERKVKLLAVRTQGKP